MSEASGAGTVQRVIAAIAGAAFLILAVFQYRVLRHEADQELANAADPAIPDYDCAETRELAAASDAHPHAFRDFTDQLRIDFEHRPGPLGTWFMPESTGCGVAVLDFDRDGLSDLYFVNCAASPHPEVSDTRHRTNRLFRRTTSGTFEDVTDGSGLADTGYGSGVAVGDVNNDGWPDVFVTNYGQDMLYQNLQGGRFSHLQSAFDQPESDWGAAACFVDFDRDGWLDLFVVNYTADAEYGHVVSCGFDHGLVSYCGPHKFQHTVDRLYRNETGDQPAAADGSRAIRFRDITEEAGLDAAVTAGFGAVCHDLTGDGWPDLFVANDGAPNRLWVNQRDGRFEEEALQRGVSCNGAGIPEAGMGAVVGDVNHDELPDLLLTHLTRETATLYEGMQGGFYQDTTPGTVLEDVSRRHTGWGVALADLNHDGRLDIPIVNGLVIPCHSGFPFHGEDEFHRREALIRDDVQYWLDYADQNALLLGTEDGLFTEHKTAGGDFTTAIASGRGLAISDLDDDGDLDLIVTNCGSSARCYENRMQKPGNWLQFQLLSRHGNRDAIGATVTLQLNDGSHRTSSCLPQTGYLCSNDSRVHFGLPADVLVESIRVDWADGAPETSAENFAAVDLNQVVVLKQTTGIPAESQHDSAVVQ